MDPAPSPLPFHRLVVEAGHAAGTDKIAHHRYDRSYALHLEPYRHWRQWALLEIGYGSGAGLTFWRQLFPEAFVYCLDRDVALQQEQALVLQADQASLESLEAALAQIHHRPLGLIVDDGSHHPAHQLQTFSLLWPALLHPGGTYVIEDIETSYWRQGVLYGYPLNYGLQDGWSCLEAFKLAVDYLNRRFLCAEDRSLLAYRLLSIGLDPQALRDVEQISFGPNCIVIRKAAAEDAPLLEAPYAHARCTERLPRPPLR